MMRNEKGQFVSEKEVNLDEELKAAEEKVAALKKQKEEAEAEQKKALAESRKAEATVVNTAIDAYEEGKVTCNQKIKAAYDKYRAEVAEAEKELSVLEQDADKKLNEFLKVHPEGFHYTYKSKDGKITRDYSYRCNQYNLFEKFNEYLEAIDRLF